MLGIINRNVIAKCITTRGSEMILLNVVKTNEQRYASSLWKVWSEKKKDWYNCSSTTEFYRLNYHWAEHVNEGNRKKWF